MQAVAAGGWCPAARSDLWSGAGSGRLPWFICREARGRGRGLQRLGAGGAGWESGRQIRCRWRSPTQRAATQKARWTIIQRAQLSFLYFAVPSLLQWFSWSIWGCIPFPALCGWGLTGSAFKDPGQPHALEMWAEREVMTLLFDFIFYLSLPGLWTSVGTRARKSKWESSLVYGTTIQWERAISHRFKISFKCLEAILKQVKRKQVNFNTFYVAQNIWTEIIISVWNQYKIMGFFLFFFLLSFSHTRVFNTWCEFSLKHISFQTDIWKSH